jgi:predicted phage terminase large subunit-like protein
MRWFTRDGDDVVWVDPSWRDPDGQPGRSMQFVPATIYDNPTLLAANPEYLSSLRTLPLLERERLLMGNWHIRADGNIFKRDWFQIIDELPAGMRRQCRYWDLASTEETAGRDPDYTAGALLYLGHEGPWRGKWVIADVDRFRGTPGTVDARVLQRAKMDGRTVTVGVEEEPGASGKRTTADFRTRLLVGYDVQAIRPTGDLLWRARPLSSAAEAGNVYLLRGDWNDAFLAEAQRFGSGKAHDDQISAICGAREVIVAGGVPAAGISAPSSRPRPGQQGWGPRRGYDKGGHAQRPGPMSRVGNTRRRAR